MLQESVSRTKFGNDNYKKPQVEIQGVFWWEVDFSLLLSYNRHLMPTERLGHIGIIQEQPRVAKQFKVALETQGFNTSLISPASLNKGEHPSLHLVLVDEATEANIPPYLPQIITGLGTNKNILHDDGNIIGFVLYKDFLDKSLNMPPFTDIASYTATYIKRVFAREKNHHTLRQRENLIESGEVTLNTEREYLEVSGNSRHLTRTEANMLRALLENPNVIFSHAELFRAGKDDPLSNYSKRANAVNISNLRSKLGPEHAGDIKTVRGVGYRYVPKLG